MGRIGFSLVSLLVAGVLTGCAAQDDDAAATADALVESSLFSHEIEPRTAAPAIVAESSVGVPFDEVASTVLAGFEPTAATMPAYSATCPGQLLEDATGRRAWRYKCGIGTDTITIGRAPEGGSPTELVPERQWGTERADENGVWRVTHYQKWAAVVRMAPLSFTFGPAQAVSTVTSGFYADGRPAFVEEAAEAIPGFDPAMYGAKWQPGMKLRRRDSALDPAGRVYRHDVWWTRTTP